MPRSSVSPTWLTSMSIPNTAAMPALSQNTEGLRKHAMLVSIFNTADIDPAVRQWQSWLVHCLVKATRHYNAARELVLAQQKETRQRANPGETRLPMFDFAFEMEDCLTALDRAVGGITVLAGQGALDGAGLDALDADRRALRKLRNKVEHGTDITSGQAGRGPIFVSVTQDGAGIQLLNRSLSFASLVALIGAAYVALAAHFPNHDAGSVPQLADTTVIRMWATLTATPGSPAPDSGAAADSLPSPPT